MSRWHQVERAVRHYASIPVAILCLATLYLFISVGYQSILGPILGAAIGAVAAAFILHIVRPEEGNSTYSPPDYRIAGIVSCLYIFSIFVMYRLTLYERPTAHYLVFGGFAGYIAYEIASGARKVRVIPQLLVLTFFTYWSPQLAFPAGMFQPDTRAEYLPVIRTALTDGTIEGLMRYLGHLVYVTETTIVTGLSVRISYFILSTLVLTSTILVISMLDRVFKSVSSQIALYSALFFGCMGWTLGRGFHPGKLSFFYVLILLLAIVVLVQYSSTSQQQQQYWMIIGLIVGLALSFGHRFSAGAGLILIGSILLFILISPLFLSENTIHGQRKPAIIFVSVYGLMILGTIHQTALVGRLVGLVSSILISGGGSSSSSSGGGPGRYSELSIELLTASTAGEAILFGLGILGAAIAIRYVEWEFDLVIFWMGILAIFLAISLVFNAADTQPQRFYALLGLFGLNVLGGVALVYLVQSDISLFTPHTVGLIVFSFAVLSLASPIAGMHLSIVSDDIPHARYYNTDQLTTGENWVDSYEGNEETMLRTMSPVTDLPYESTTETTAVVNTSEIQSGDRYVYTQSAASTGVRGEAGQGLGDRVFWFLELDPSAEDDVIYMNGETTVYQRSNNMNNTGNI